jgi:hypothetical protein
MKVIFQPTQSVPKIANASMAALFCLFGLAGGPVQSESIAPNSVGNQPQDISPDKKAQLLVVLIYDESCTVACTVVKPIVRDLVSGHQVQYEELNTSPKELKNTLARAKALKLETFVSDRTEEVPVVGIFTSKGKRLKELTGRKTREVYKEAIEKAMEKSKS